MESTGATRTVPKIDTSCHVHASVAIPHSRATSEYSIQCEIRWDCNSYSESPKATFRVKSLQWYTESYYSDDSTDSSVQHIHWHPEWCRVQIGSPCTREGQDIFSNPEMIVFWGGQLEGTGSDSHVWFRTSWETVRRRNLLPGFIISLYNHALL